MNLKKNISRRQLAQFGMKAGLLTQGLGGALSMGGLGLSDVAFGDTDESGEPHFLLTLFVKGGIDWSYLFDARPLDQTAAKLRTNYMTNPDQPTIWKGVNGGQTKVTPIVKPLEKYLKYFSILNGVLMADNFDGHEQNVNFYFTGNPFGGDWYAPFLNPNQNFPLDSLIIVGQPFSEQPTNAGSTLSLSYKNLGMLASSSKGQNNRLEPYMNFAIERSEAISNGSKGAFAKGAKMMADGIRSSQNLQNRLIKLGNPDTIVDAITKIFSSKVSRTITLSLDAMPNMEGFNLDVHGFEDTKRSQNAYRNLIENVSDIFEKLSKIQYPGTKKSYLELTTIVMTSEFNRTTRQIGIEFSQSGTDHNPLSNTILIGGKGIKPNYIVGATDLDSIKDGKFVNVSKAHLGLDPELIKAIGRPFDPISMEVLPILPTSYERKQYLTIENVINTLLKSFGVKSKDQLRPYKDDRSGKPAPSLDKLLAS